MLYGKFDDTGNLLDISNDSNYLNRVDLNDWSLIEGFVLEDINFAENTFNKDENGVISLETIMAPTMYSEVLPSDYSFVDSEGRIVSEELSFEGGGVNSSNSSGWFRRFNGMTINNTTGMFFGRGAVIEFIEVTSDGDTANRRFQLFHYDLDGRDGVKIYDQPVTDLNNQFLFDENIHLYIPPFRRFAAFMSGASFRYPQYRIGYRRVF